ncbi:MAG: hypothetical protein Q8O89_00340 [Nanoarchaeota archaeon]|nr:hypothetical protein [Nanoarchaeota archaeon]
MARKKDVEEEVFKSEEQEDEVSSDEKKLEMDEGLIDEEIYTEDGREKLMENDEIDDWEEGFMKGASGGGSSSKCINCGKVFIDETQIVSKDIDDREYWFCSEKCANVFERKKSQ